MTSDTMADLPRITVVTCSFNQGRFIRQTIESVLSQRYPNIEHIVADGLSTDETAAILAEYPHLRVVRDRDAGQADAINNGFRLATGQIYCFLNSDDTFEPGALHRVAREIDPTVGRHVVMGRCRFVDEEGRFIGVEHQSAFESHRRVLEIWKGYSIPQPAVFWTREVWLRCGPLDEHEQFALDYDLFCRFSRDYEFHTFEQIVANYRLHVQSKTQGVDDATRLSDSVRVSRRYWGPAWTPMGVAIRASYYSHMFDRRGRAYRNLQAAKHTWQDGRRAASLPRLVLGTVLGPDVAFHALAGPVARRAGGRIWQHLSRLRRLVGKQPLSPQTKAWFGFHDMHQDQWVGPVFERDLHVTDDLAGGTLRFEGETVPEALPGPLVLDVTVGSDVQERVELRAAAFAHDFPLANVRPGIYRLKVRASVFIVPQDRWGNGDYRPLSYRLTACDLKAAAASDSHGVRA